MRVRQKAKYNGGIKYVSVEVADVPGAFILDGDDDVHCLPCVHHHIPRIAVESVRPVVITLEKINTYINV